MSIQRSPAFGAASMPAVRVFSLPLRVRYRTQLLRALYTPDHVYFFAHLRLHFGGVTRHFYQPLGSLFRAIEGRAPPKVLIQVRVNKRDVVDGLLPPLPFYAATDASKRAEK